MSPSRTNRATAAASAGSSEAAVKARTLWAASVKLPRPICCPMLIKASTALRIVARLLCLPAHSRTERRIANSSKAPLTVVCAPWGGKFTIDFVNFAGAKGKMFVMQKHANVSHELTYLLCPHRWPLFAQKSLSNPKLKGGLPLEFFITIW